ncbi:ketohexokinase isoform X2 [Dendrobium catenatum]|uniref:ketohexokinase isoform X2 n=1 Tax=Dendrobium catenatum TaxID=906689 RepID=UPI0010A0BD26|nr:ketohexokinase isoform X2 [Dendrobium catenatum]
MAEAVISEAHGLFSSDLPPLPENRIVVGFGMVSVDYVAIVDAFPKPDEKVRGRSLQVFGGGNAANALTCASRLGLTPKLITKVGDDSLGQIALAELEADGVDTSLVKISDGGTSTSTYVIVDKQMKTRTCIYTLGVPAMVPDDLPKTKLVSALNEAKLAYFDGRSTKPALVVAQEAWTSASSIPKALVSILLKYPNVKFVIATLGEKGCVMIDRRTPGEDPHLDAIDVDSLTESLKLRIDENVTTPTLVTSESSVRLRADGIGTLYGKLLLGTAEKIPPSEILDTTGAGDAFIGAVLYALCAGMPPEKMLPFSCQVDTMKKKNSCSRPHVVGQRLDVVVLDKLPPQINPRGSISLLVLSFIISCLCCL